MHCHYLATRHVADEELACILVYVCSRGTAAHPMILALLPPPLLDAEAGPAGIAQLTILVEVCRFSSKGGVQATAASDLAFIQGHRSCTECGPLLACRTGLCVCR